ncbi:hypothetical protein LEN26_010737 [Aphanomyces euteiches]|nr:hypothetical protein AeMF1_011035 [Aphanomyces euteiches]KAH9121300.1 hypothetical protein LEN26_010737 [Aphanomyces euteiches]KAH9186481.1 hypothetical protein AeNC1_011546 [Aphanomyces euteiches]
MPITVVSRKRRSSIYVIIKMTKVYTTRRYEPTVRLNRWSVAYNCLFVLNLATTPFMAYMSEPLPGVIAQTNIPDWNSFQEYTQVMTTFFQTVMYNKTTSTSTIVTVHDASSNAFALRYTLDLPYSIPDDQVHDCLLGLPASIYHGAQVQVYLSKFVTSNAEHRAVMKPWRICEHNYLVGVVFSEMCFWMDEIEPVPNSTSPRYHVWAALYWFETPLFSWFKLVFRSLVTTHVLYVFWTRYYRHFRILVHNLRCFGLGQEYIHYQIVLGDPGYAALTDPFVSLAMFVDIWCGTAYMMMAILRVSQFQDLWAYALGCMYPVSLFPLRKLRYEGVGLPQIDIKSTANCI